MQVVGVFCEDIREEKSGQSTLIGILSDNINVTPPPPRTVGRAAAGLIPKMGLYVRINLNPDEDGPGAMTLKLLFSDGRELVLGVISEEVIAQSKAEAKSKSLPIAGILSSAVVAPFPAPNPPTLITAVLDTKNSRVICGILNIVIDPAQAISSNASPQPVSQSPPVVPARSKLP